MRGLHPFLLVSVLFAVQPAFAHAAEKVTYVTDVLPVLRNSCLNCHNPDKHKAGLDMSSYQGIMQGSDSGKVIEPGNPGNSLLLKLISHTDEPAMPPKSDKLPDSQINLIRKWIEGFAMETNESQAAIVKSKTPELEMFAVEKASGPVPMPRNLLLEPLFRTPRAGSVVSLAASPRAPLLAVAGQKQVLLYDTNSLELAGVLSFPEGFPEVVKFSRDGRFLIAGGGMGAKSGCVVVWDVTSGHRVMQAGDEFDTVLAADISPDLHLIAMGGPNRMVKIFRDGKLLHSIKKHTDWVTALAFTSDGKLLVSGDRQGGLCAWDVATGGEIFTLPSHKAGVTALAAPGPQACLSASEDGTIKLWDLREGKEVKNWEAHKGGALSVAFSPDGRLVTCGRDKLARLWTRDGNKLKEFEIFGDIALSAAISGDKVIASDWTGLIRVWNFDGKRVGELTSNPPMLVERLTDVETRLTELRLRRQKIIPSLAAGEKAAAESSAKALAAAQLATEKEKQMNAEAAGLMSLKKKTDEAIAAEGKLRTEYTQLQMAATTLNLDIARALAAGDVAQRDQKLLEGTMQEKQEHAEHLAEVLKAAQEAADQHRDDQALADTAAKAKADAERAQEDLEAGEKTVSSKDGEVQRIKDAVTKTNEALAANKESLQSANHKLAEQSALVETCRSSVATANDSLNKSKAGYEELSRNLPPKSAAAEVALKQLAKVKLEAAGIEHEIVVGNAEWAKWRAAQVNTLLYAARNELDERRAELMNAGKAAHDASAELDKAQAGLAAAERFLAEAPQRTKSLEDAIVAANQQVEKARAASVLAKETVLHKETLLGPVSGLAIMMASESVQAPDDVTLKQASAKAAETLELLKRDLSAARETADARNASVEQAIQIVAAAATALEQDKMDIEREPAKIAGLRNVVEEVTKRTLDARVAADRKAAGADEFVKDAQKKVDALSHEFETLCLKAQAASSSVAELTKQ